MENNLFPPGAKVFAKMKGYVAWPAAVDGRRRNTGKYDVFFYGTHQVGVCREEDLRPYVENRSTLGRPKHFKGFNEAVQEMDLELGFVNQSDSSDSLEPENQSSHKEVKKRRGRSRSNSENSETPVKRGRGRPRSLSRTRIDSPEVKKRGRGSMSQSGSRSVSRSRLQPTIRQGRSMSRTMGDALKGDPTWKPYKSKSRSTSCSTRQVARKRHSVSLSGGDSDSYVEPNLKALQCVINPDIESADAKREALRFFKNEAALNDAVFGIQASLSLKEADLVAAMKHIDEFFIIELNPLLLKKHPDAVETFEKLKIYSGNVKNWNMTNSAKVAFKHEVNKINAKAHIIYKQFKELFHVPEGKDFSQTFEEELEKFRIATQGIPMETVWKMTRDPVLV